MQGKAITLRVRRLSRLVLLCCGTMLLLSGCAGLDRGAPELAKSASPRRRVFSISKTVRLPADKEESGSVPTPPLPPVVLRDAPEVRAYIRGYTSVLRPLVVSGLQRREQYLSLIEGVFREYGLPMELANVALIESRFDEDAVSEQGASGMWQFMKGTAETYGLQVSFWRDERFDAEKSTVAAAAHLKDLYLKFNDWPLTLAAYNAGCGRVERAIRNGGTRDVFELSRGGHLPRETGNYVAKFLAVTLVTRHLDVYGFDAQRQPFASRDKEDENDL